MDEHKQILKENKKLLEMIHEYQKIQGNVIINELQNIKNQIVSLERKIGKISQYFEEI